MALSTIGTAAIADDAITAAKIDDDGAGFTFGDVTTGALTATGATTGIVTFDKLTLDGSSAATVTVNSAVSGSTTVAVDGVSGTIAVGMVVNVSDTTVRSIIDASSETAVSVDDTLTITAVASQTSFTVSEAVSIADNVVLILRADESSKMVLDASAASTDVGDEILFEDATSDGSISLIKSNAENFIGTISLTADSISEGGAATTNIAQGLCKHWMTIAMDSATVLDSFNAGAITDNGTGDFTQTITSVMSKINYSNTIGSLYVQAWGNGVFFRTGTARTTALYRTGSVNMHTNGNATDSPQYDTQVCGDLA
jgi:hypothetical protein